MLGSKGEIILQHLENQESLSSREIFEQVAHGVSYATLKRILVKLVDEQILVVQGQAKATRYTLSPAYRLVRPIDLDAYFQQETDERTVRSSFQHGLIHDILPQIRVFNDTEIEHLQAIQQQFTDNISALSPTEYNKEFERLAIDLSWKSSQIEGNTYSLLETEMLLIEKETARGKTREEATMLLNHKEALDFLLTHPHFISPLRVSKIEEIHSILVKELPIDRNLRKRRIGITGTNYTPLDNDFQIREALEQMCELIESRPNAFEKALLALALISYIQPFADGNKRTARIISNALLISEQHCPLSYRTVDSIAYKKAILVFYEQNNLYPIKALFKEQFEFAVQTYF